MEGKSWLHEIPMKTAEILQQIKRHNEGLHEQRSKRCRSDTARGHTRAPADSSRIQRTEQPNSTPKAMAAWDPKFASLLELAEAYVPVRWSRRVGVCHTCTTGLIGGSIVYNPEPLERPAPGCSYAVPSQTRMSFWIFGRNGRSLIMRSDIAPAGIFPNYELPDHTGKLRKLSEPQGEDPLLSAA